MKRNRILPVGCLMFFFSGFFVGQSSWADQLYLPAVNYGVGPGPYDVAIGDFDSDGHPDLAVANDSDADVSVLLGNADGAFQAATDYWVGTGPASLAIGDWNGDGHPDLVVGVAGEWRMALLLGIGDGTFQTAVNLTTDVSPNSVAIGDLNGDGHADLAVVNWGSNVSVLLGNGDTGVLKKTQYQAGENPASAVIGDLNGDGHLDLAVANYGCLDCLPPLPSSVSVLLNNGDGTFQPAVNYGAGLSPHAVAIGDLNGDGHPDLVVANSEGNNVSVLLGNGDGSFQAAVDYGVGDWPTSVAMGEFNGDGYLDLAVSCTGVAAVSVLLGNGDGTFQTRGDYGTGDRPISVATEDFNNDGHPDLAVANFGSNNVSVLLNASPCTVPDSPSLSSPLDGATDTSTTPTLGWNAVAWAGSYDVQVCTDSECSSVVRSAAGLTTTQWTVSPALELNTTYFWRARVHTACGTSSWSGTWGFEAALCSTPDIPSLISPSDGTANSSTTPVLLWGAGSCASSYEAQVCMDSDCSSVVRWASNFGVTQWTVSPPLNKSTAYRWRVRAHNAYGTSPWSQTWGLTTGDCFIATASFETEMVGKINVLRYFRDQYLVKSEEGRAFVDAYYSVSPPIAEWIAGKGWVRAVVRTLLLPVVGLVWLFV